MIKHLSAPLLLVVALTSTRAAGPTIAIDAASPAGNVSRLFYELMTAEINQAYDGGLYAEPVQNRAFLDDASALPAHGIVVLTLEAR
jgi:alpha-N-arabinofuranosidase